MARPLTKSQTLRALPYSTAGETREAGGAGAALLALERHQVAAHLAPERLLGARGEGVFAGLDLQQQAVAVAHGEGDVAARQGEPEDGVEALGLLGLRPLEELAAGGHVPEEVAHFHGGARGAPAAEIRGPVPPSTSMRVPCGASFSQVSRVKRLTAAMLGRASPRNP